MVHLADDHGVKIGRHTTVGHSAIIHACTIGDECLVGMGATVLDGAVIGDQCIIGANSLVTQRFVAPPGSMILGSPAKIVRALTPEERAGLKKWALKWVRVSPGIISSPNAGKCPAGFAPNNRVVIFPRLLPSPKTGCLSYN